MELIKTVNDLIEKYGHAFDDPTVVLHELNTEEEKFRVRLQETRRRIQVDAKDIWVPQGDEWFHARSIQENSLVFRHLTGHHVPTGKENGPFAELIHPIMLYRMDVTYHDNGEVRFRIMHGLRDARDVKRHIIPTIQAPGTDLERPELLVFHLPFHKTIKGQLEREKALYMQEKERIISIADAF